MTVMAEIPGDAKTRGADGWTIDDLEHVPDDGQRYELLDGLLLVSPAPVLAHQRAARGVFRLLDADCPPELEALFAPVDWQPSRTTSFQPDVLVIRRDDTAEKNVTEPLTLAVEVLSQSTRARDLGPKRDKYEAAGVASYWVVDPDGASVRVWELVDDRYHLVGAAAGEQVLELERPFAVKLAPSASGADYIG